MILLSLILFELEVGVLWPSQHCDGHVKPVSQSTPSFLGQAINQYLYTYFCQKLTTSLFESADEGEWTIEMIS